jgi:hypothetical protein
MPSRFLVDDVKLRFYAREGGRKVTDYLIGRKKARIAPGFWA